MFDQLFGSKTRFTLLKLFLAEDEKAFYIRELTRITDSQINSVRRELEKLHRIGIVRVIDSSEEPDYEQIGPRERKYYKVNEAFILLPELKELFLKSDLMGERDLYSQLKYIGDISYLALSGVFSKVTSPTDILIVGSVNREKLLEIVEKIEKQLNQDVRYTIMGDNEYRYRKDVTDKFLLDFLGSKKIVLVDNAQNIV